MKIILQFLGNKFQRPWHTQMEKQLKRLETVASISTAEVALEQRNELKPPFSLRILLAVPGPDIHAEAREHTFQAALLKVVNKLLRQIKLRKANQLRGRHRQPSRKWSGTLAGHRA